MYRMYLYILIHTAKRNERWRSTRERLINLILGILFALIIAVSQFSMIETPSTLLYN